MRSGRVMSWHLVVNRDSSSVKLSFKVCISDVNGLFVLKRRLMLKMMRVLDDSHWGMVRHRGIPGMLPGDMRVRLLANTVVINLCDVMLNSCYLMLNDRLMLFRVDSSSVGANSMFTMRCTFDSVKSWL